MKTFSEAAMREIIAGTAIVTGAVEILSDPEILLWGGYGLLSIGGKTYEGIGAHGLVQVSSGAIGGAAQNLTLTLSGIEAAALDVLEAEEVRRASVAVYRVIFAGDGRTMLDAQVFTRGRLDELVTEETIGAEATIRALVESAARGLGRSGGRMRSDADQRLVKADDGFFRNVSFAAEKQLYWGGKKPSRAGSALGGVKSSGISQEAVLARFLEQLD